MSYGDALMQSSPSNANSAIVQAAIWTVEYNNGNYNGNGTYTGGTNYLTVTGNDCHVHGHRQRNCTPREAHGGSGGQLIGLNGVQGRRTKPRRLPRSAVASPSFWPSAAYCSGRASRGVATSVVRSGLPIHTKQGNDNTRCPTRNVSENSIG